ncbi:LysR substrate-binding domain-containing protein [Enterovibrio sp. ZSDZ35]|uniref:LysR substrate-binding domain-containing protein n=1 Tax=Enterovibrio qingdaonensis TaxID=2899818 RepID=A0ABT5QUM2_9GAMM|nr:LysR substrate-binding domain-containing protein [Enterovibrio sp. ZSDZ35]MDD1784428.1 LysR substrate-binding domain-containing protein [Enterovibrio sp. ZSDZ35]
MDDKKRTKTNRVSHLNGIRAFEASARHLSFATAAQELNVTAAAVGQQVRQLEDWLGVKLFERASSGSARLSLTKNARQALPDIQAGITHLSMGLEKMRGIKDKNVIVVSASPTIASKWLLPLLDEFWSQYPELDIQVETDVTLVDYLEKGIDIGIRYGLGQWEGLAAQHLMFEYIYPVCSKEYFDRMVVNEGMPNSLQGLTLIYDISVASSPGYPSWKEWCEKKHVVEPDRMNGLKINNFSSVVELAIRGSGIALGREKMISQEMQNGDLICPFGLAESQLRSQFCYYLVWPEDRALSGNVAVFRDWLVSKDLN